MSSILKALKKLEGEKSQRDELSTAVASDILRSSRQRAKNRWFYALVAVIGVLVIAATGYYLGSRTGKITSSPVADSIQNDSRPAQPTVVRQPKKVQANSSSEVAPTDLPRLSGIVYQADAENRLAIINDLPVMEGTLVEGYTVSAIGPGTVVLHKDGAEYRLELKPQ
ncbi:MAG: hypothetical protein C0623_10650 [Desulfuromonas sp.]|nr:MAG: hypothetical protein C0623_10650 [Desulfuromonas sp.]